MPWEGTGVASPLPHALHQGPRGNKGGAAPTPPQLGAAASAPPRRNPRGRRRRRKRVNRKLAIALPAASVSAAPWHQPSAEGEGRAGRAGGRAPLPAQSGATAAGWQGPWAGSRPFWGGGPRPPSLPQRTAGLPANDIYSLIRNLIKVSYHNVMALHFCLLVRQLIILHFQAGGGGGGVRAEG